MQSIVSSTKPYFSFYSIIYRGLDFMAKSNIFIALGAVSIGHFVFLIIGNEFSSRVYIFHFFLFFATLFTYNYHRLVSAPSQIKNYQYWIGSISFFLAVLLFNYLPEEVKKASILPATICILYPMKILGVRLRQVPYLKIFLIAFVWAFSSVILPYCIWNNYSILDIIQNSTISILFIVVFLYVLAETLPFDIRDKEEDTNNRMKTLPIKLGDVMSKRICLILYLSLSAILILLLAKNQYILVVYSGLTSLIYSSIVLMNLKVNRSNLQYTIGMESALIMPVVFYYLMGSFFH